MSYKKLVLAVVLLSSSLAYGGPRTITYQGSVLNSSGQPILDGGYRMRFGLYTVPTGGGWAWMEEETSVTVKSGLFSVILGDGTSFGTLFATYPDLYLQVWIDLDRSGGAYTANETYTPRQKLAGAGWALDADTLDTRHASYFATAAHTHPLTGWLLTGNAGTTSGTSFLGTTDNVALDLRVNNKRGLRIMPGAAPSLIGGYSGNSITSGVQGATIAGGGESGKINLVAGNFGAVGGGSRNTAQGEFSTIAGGTSNTAMAGETVIGGGLNNRAEKVGGTIGGGVSNVSSGTIATIAGGAANIASGAGAFIGGGMFNQSTGTLAVVGGGGFNIAGEYGATVAGGGGQYLGSGSAVPNTALGMQSTVSGGSSNTAIALYATVGGGYRNTAFGTRGVVAGGGGNHANGGWSTVAGGYLNIANGSYGSVAGGQGNTANGDYSTVTGGDSNSAHGNYSLAAGRRAKAVHNGSFVWADGQNSDTSSTANNQFIVRAGGGMMVAAQGGAFPPEAQLHVRYHSVTRPQLKIEETNPGDFVRFRLASVILGPMFWDIAASGDQFNVWYSETSQNILQLFPINDPITYPDLLMMSNGAHLTRGGVWTSVSDRAAKANFRPADGREVLEQVANLPIQTWNYRAEQETTRHMGPTGQDFYAAFSLGDSDKGIGMVDADGVALAAIQGLYKIVREKNAEIETLQKQNAALEARLAALEAVVTKTAEKQPR